MDAAGHALCNAHLLRELAAVTETGGEDDVIWARQAIDALLALKEAADAACQAGRGAIDPEILHRQSRWFREAAEAGIALNSRRRSKLQKKRHAPAAPAYGMLLTLTGSTDICSSAEAPMRPTEP